MKNAKYILVAVLLITSIYLIEATIYNPIYNSVYIPGYSRVYNPIFSSAYSPIYNPLYGNNMNQNYNSCTVSNQRLSINQASNETPHFSCCVNDYCAKGNSLKKSVTLTKENSSAISQADISAYTKNNTDNVDICLKARNLEKNKNYTVWLETGLGEELNIGSFKSNIMGTGSFKYKGKLNDFTIYEKIEVRQNDTVIMTGNLKN